MTIRVRADSSALVTLDGVVYLRLTPPPAMSELERAQETRYSVALTDFNLEVARLKGQIEEHEARANEAEEAYTTLRARYEEAAIAPDRRATELEHELERARGRIAELEEKVARKWVDGSDK